MQNDRIRYLDSLRGLAILGVFITHCGSAALVSGSKVRMITDIGGMGVPLFYVISALTLCMMFSRRVNVEPKPVMSFYVRRMMRIAPVYWLGIVLYTAIYGVYGSRGWQPGPELWHYPVHFLFLNMTNPITPSSVVPGGWSISNEVLFYGLFPAIYFLTNSRNRAIGFFVFACLLMPLTAKLLHPLLDPAFRDINAGMVKQFWYRYLPSQLACFAAGIVLHHLLSTLNFEKVKSKKVAFTAVVVLGALFAAANSLKHWLPIHHVWSIWFVLLALGLRSFQWKLIVNPALSYLGRISFSLYIFHFLVIKGILSVPAIAAQSPNVKFAILTVLAGALSILLAHIGFTYYEGFFIRLTPKLVAKIQGTTAPVPSKA